FSSEARSRPSACARSASFHTSGLSSSRSTSSRRSTLRSKSKIPPERSEEHTSELQSRENLVCRLLLEKKKKKKTNDNRKGKKKTKKRRLISENIKENKQTYR